MFKFTFICRAVLPLKDDSGRVRTHQWRRVYGRAGSQSDFRYRWLGRERQGPPHFALDLVRDLGEVENRAAR